MHHVGHANADYVAGWTGSTMTDNQFAGNDGINHNYMLFHSHGCICGDFAVHCVLEKMVTITTGFVVTTGNSRYGWYEPWGDGMAAHIHREMIDAYCHDHIPSIGAALREAKIATAPWVAIPYVGDDGVQIGTENGYLRWNIYCLNILGDGALYPWFEEPFTPNVVYEQGLKTGATSTTVHVSHFDTPLDNFRVSLFDGETLLGFGITDENGDAVLTFSPALDVVGEMRLIVTGQSAWPQTLEVIGFESGEPFVYGDILALDDDPVFGTQRYVICDLYNVGDMTANLVYPEITTDCEYVSSIPSNLIIADFAPNSTQHFETLGLINIADNIPDQTIFTLNLTTYVGDVAHTTQKSFLALAPNLQFDKFVVEDVIGDDNGYADPGESFILHIQGKNVGHAMAPGTYLTAYCDDNRLQIAENTVTIGDVEPDGSFTADLYITSDADIVSGTVFHLDLSLVSGEYVTSLDHSLSVGIAVETFESGDFSFLDWFHVGDLPWTITNEEAHNGTYCARSGAIDHDQVTKLIVYADILTDGEISFWFKTSTELRKDLFAFFIDNNKKDWWSGENDWTYASYSFSAGSHAFIWLYDKNGHGVSGEDCAWIDDITFPRTCIISGVEEVVTTRENAIYPNPTQGSFTLELAEESNVGIFNMLGQQVMQLENVSGSQQVSLEGAPKGMYFVRIQSGNGIEVVKVIVR